MITHWYSISQYWIFISGYIITKDYYSPHIILETISLNAALTSMYIRTLSQFSYSGDELSGVGGLKISFDFRNFDFWSIFTPVELETSSSEALSQSDLWVDFARVLLNLSCSLPPCFAFEDEVCLGEEARIGRSS